MILLSGQTLTPATWFRPDSQSLSLVDNGISTSTITVGPSAPEMTVGAWLKDDTDPGKGIVWRVKSIETTYERQTRTIQLEHVVATLKDAVVFGTLGGTTNVSASTMITRILAGQSIWQLGTFAFSRSLPYQFNNQNRYQMIETVCGTLTDWRWEYNLTALPFKLNIVRKSTAVACEMRSTRNLISLKRTVDRSGMYTRFYPVGARNLHIDGDYVSKNESIYGTISKVETDQSIGSKALLQAWAEDRLERHCEPVVTVTISGLELSAATGEPLDKLTLGTMCRVPLPEYNTTIVERITKLAWSDKIKSPEQVTVTLANQLQDAASIIRQTASSGSRNAGGSAQAQEEDHAWIVDTTDHVGLVAEAIIGRDGETVDWSRVSEIIVDGEGIHQRVTQAQGDIITNTAAIEVNESAIRAEVTRATGAEGTLSSRITVEADRITSEVTRATDAEGALGTRVTQTENNITSEVTRATNAETTLGTRVTQTEDDILSAVGRISDAEDRIGDAEDDITTIEGTALYQNRDNIVNVAGKFSVVNNNVHLDTGSALYVTRDGVSSYVVGARGVASAINQNAQNVRITASKIDLDGYVTMSELSATNAEITNLKTGVTRATLINVVDFNASDTVQGRVLYATEQLSVGSSSSAATMYFNGFQAKWKSMTVVKSASINLPSASVTTARDFVYAYNGDLTDLKKNNGRILNSWSSGSVSISSDTIYYIGRDAPS